VLLDHLFNGTRLLVAAARALRRVLPAPAPRPATPPPVARADASAPVLVASAGEPELQPVELDTPLQFACHPGVPCFNQCCAGMRIALPPYDVLRLRQALGLGSRDFLDRYTEARTSPRGLPVRLLRMAAGDGTRCPWVGAQGCGVYAHRPMVCRLFPLGRSVEPDAQGLPRQQLVLQRLPICRGFDEARPCTPRQWLEEQGLAPYLELDDRHSALVRHVLSHRLELSPRQTEEVELALYDLDRFRLVVAERGLLLRLRVRTAERQAIRRDDEALLRFGFAWVEQLLQVPVRPATGVAAR
jgi:hypothetical protein